MTDKPTKELIRGYIAELCQDTGTDVVFAFMGFGTWTMFCQDFSPEERLVENITCGPGRVGRDRRFLEVDFTKVFADMFVKEGTVNFVVTNTPDGIPVIRSRNGLSYIEI